MALTQGSTVAWADIRNLFDRVNAERHRLLGEDVANRAVSPTQGSIVQTSTPAILKTLAAGAISGNTFANSDLSTTLASINSISNPSVGNLLTISQLSNLSAYLSTIEAYNPSIVTGSANKFNAFNFNSAFGAGCVGTFNSAFGAANGTFFNAFTAVHTTFFNAFTPANGTFFNAFGAAHTNFFSAFGANNVTFFSAFTAVNGTFFGAFFRGCSSVNNSHNGTVCVTFYHSGNNSFFSTYYSRFGRSCGTFGSRNTSFCFSFCSASFFSSFGSKNTTFFNAFTTHFGTFGSRCGTFGSRNGTFSIIRRCTASFFSSFCSASFFSSFCSASFFSRFGSKNTTFFNAFTAHFGTFGSKNTTFFSAFCSASFFDAYTSYYGTFNDAGNGTYCPGGFSFDFSYGNFRLTFAVFNTSVAVNAAFFSAFGSANTTFFSSFTSANGTFFSRFTAVNTTFFSAFGAANGTFFSAFGAENGTFFSRFTNTGTFNSRFTSGCPSGFYSSFIYSFSGFNSAYCPAEFCTVFNAASFFNKL